MEITKNNPDTHRVQPEPIIGLLFENAAIGIAQVDNKGRILLANNKFLEITGYSKDELLK